ncbi:MAG: glycogen debranching protein GlgX [candidate division KSB1 bacterium]|nr:glycogen debranching protein GlgX [candidate division KSB1 bacterium]
MDLHDLHPHRLYGRSFPLGATVYADGVNFSIYSKNAYAVELLLFDDVDAPRPERVITLDPKMNRTSYYWHCFVPGIGQGQLYGWRAYGPFEPAKGLRFNGHKVLVDPYAKAVAIGKKFDREAARIGGDNCAQAIKSVVVDPSRYDWEDDYPLRRPYAESVIYEMHVKGFTRHPSSGLDPKVRGTFRGVIEKIPYLKSLGITAVELMPVQLFDDGDAPPPLHNYWGYNPIVFFALHPWYASTSDPIGVLDEFRDMVKALHLAGIEVILDVVFNHTAEGGADGPTYSFRGLGNEIYYILEEDKSRYANYSGTGNSLNANHPVVRRMILDCLRYWAMEMHVDGFRFDLASVLSRDEQGRALSNPPTLLSIETMPETAHAKIIAEAWDAAGLFQVGSFVGERWAEWNSRFRDDVRRFVRGDEGMTRSIADRLLGSPDIYGREGGPRRSINFVTCHDGFTVNDLVSYNQKHNEANLENNRDGLDENFSWNCGVEGPTDDPDIESLRLRQIKNFITILLISQGTPMLLMGDEIRRTQLGNNNAYCQDNEQSWFNWDDLKRRKDLFAFVRGVIEFVQQSRCFTSEEPVSVGEQKDALHIIWHGVHLGAPDWSPTSHTLAFTLHDPKVDERLHVLLNMYWQPLVFELPALPGGREWVRVIDTSLAYPKDFSPPHLAEAIADSYYDAAPRSVVLLAAR